MQLAHLHVEGPTAMVRATHTHRVVVIEDDHELREAMMLFLTRHGCDAAGAADGVEALACLAAGTLPCVIFLDLTMPRMDGWRFMDELRVRPSFHAIPIVVVSGYGTLDGVRSLGAADYLRKPFRLTRVVEMVGKLCPFDVQP